MKLEINELKTNKFPKGYKRYIWGGIRNAPPVLKEQLYPLQRRRELENLDSDLVFLKDFLKEEKRAFPCVIIWESPEGEKFYAEVRVKY